MIIAVIVILFLALAIVFYNRSTVPPPAALSLGAGLIVTCNRPSLRKELDCWLLTIMLWNQGADRLNIRSIEVRTPEGKTYPLGSTGDPDSRKIRLHGSLILPIDLPPGKSAIALAELPAGDAEEFSHPERHRLFVVTASDRLEFPLFRFPSS
jgi:hypothetical protein